MLSGLTELWRLWKRRRRKQHCRRTWSSPALDQWHREEENGPPIDLAINESDLWIFHEQLDAMERNITQLLQKLKREPDDMPSCSEDECVVCASNRACMQTFPCGHRVLCRKCFIRTIQMAVVDRNLPLRCVICRAKILRIKHHGASRVRIHIQQTPPVPNQNGFYPTSAVLLPPPSPTTTIADDDEHQQHRRTRHQRKLSPASVPSAASNYCTSLLKKLSGGSGGGSSSATSSSASTASTSSPPLKPRPIAPSSLHRHLC